MFDVTIQGMNKQIYLKPTQKAGAFHIRKVAKHDFPTLARVYVRAYNTLNIGEHWDAKSAQHLLKRLHNEQTDLFFVVTYKTKVIGAIAAVIKPWWDGNHMTDGELFVEPAYQRQGIGKHLIRHLFLAGKKKHNATQWHTFTHVVHAHPLSWYKRMGFEQIKEWTMISGDVGKVLKNLDAMIKS